MLYLAIAIPWLAAKQKMNSADSNWYNIERIFTHKGTAEWCKEVSVSGWVISGPFVSWYFLMQILKAPVQSTCDGDHPVVKINVKLLEILKILHVVVSWLVLVCLGNASVMLYFQQMLNSSVLGAVGGFSRLSTSACVYQTEVICSPAHGCAYCLEGRVRDKISWIKIREENT